MSTVSQRNLETAKKFLSLLEQEKIDEFVALFAPDGAQLNPYASGLFPDKIKGTADLLTFWRPVPGRFDGMKFPIEEILPLQDPTMVLVKFKGIIKLKNNAGFYNNDYLGLFKFNEQGKILEYHEYFNPLTVVKAFGLKDKL